MKISNADFKDWKRRSEMASKLNGYPIKIVSRKWNAFKSIMTIFAILLLLLMALNLYVAGEEILSTLSGISADGGNKTMMIKVIHEVTLSQDVKDYIENKTPIIWNAIKQEFGK